MTLRIAIVDDTDSDRMRLAKDVSAALAARKIPCEMALYRSGEEMLAASGAGGLGMGTPGAGGLGAGAPGAGDSGAATSDEDASGSGGPGANADIAFLDVRMEGGMDGIELAERLRALNRALVIVFVTTSREYALDAYRIHPFDYLVKPYDLGRLQGLLSDALEALVAEEPTIEVDVPYGSIPIPVGNIVSIVARGHTAAVALASGEELRSTMTYTELRTLVSENPLFLEINRGVVINMDHVVALEGATLSMDDGTHLPLRKRDRATLSRAITRHMVSRLRVRHRE